MIPFWTDIESRARDAGVKVAIEMHPHNVVFNPGTMERLATEINATHVGAEMDPSHLFWQGIDPVAAIEHLGSLVYHAAAKDTRINERNCRVYGVLDDRFERVPAGQNPVNIGGRNTLNRWPADASWQFVAVGRGHDQDFWVRFLRALYAVDPGIAVNIEHEDAELDQIEGLRQAAKNLTAAAAAAGLTVSLPGGQGEVEAIAGRAVDVVAVLDQATNGWGASRPWPGCSPAPRRGRWPARWRPRRRSTSTSVRRAGRWRGNWTSPPPWPRWWRRESCNRRR